MTFEGFQGSAVVFEGSQGAPPLRPHDAERRQSVGQLYTWSLHFLKPGIRWSEMVIFVSFIQVALQDTLLPSPVHPTGFSFCFFPGFLAIIYKYIYIQYSIKENPNQTKKICLSMVNLAYKLSFIGQQLSVMKYWLTIIGYQLSINGY